MLNYIIMFYSTQGLFQNNSIECMTDNFKYSSHNFVQYTTADTDIKEINNTFEECKEECNTDTNCLGFSRSKNISREDESTCWLKKKIDSNNELFKSNDQQYETYLKEKKEEIYTYNVTQNNKFKQKLELDIPTTEIHIDSNNGLIYKLSMSLLLKSSDKNNINKHDNFNIKINAVNKDNKPIFNNSFDFKDELNNNLSFIFKEIPIFLTISIESVNKLQQSKKLVIKLTQEFIDPRMFNMIVDRNN